MSNVIDARARFEAKAASDAEHEVRLELFDWLDYSSDLLAELCGSAPPHGLGNRSR